MPHDTRRTQVRNYVAAEEPGAGAGRAELARYAAQLAERDAQHVIQIDQVWTPGEAIQHKTNERDRAGAFLLRLAPLSALLALLGVGIVLLAGGTWGQGIVSFAALSIGGYWLLSKLDYQHSAAGLERHRIDRAAQIKTVELRERGKTARAAVQQFARALEDKGAGE